MTINKRTKTVIIGATIFILLCIVGIGFIVNSYRKVDSVINVQDSEELYMMSKGTYEDGSIRYGFMNQKGETVIEPKYRLVTEFFDGVTFVQDSMDEGYLMDINENKICAVKGWCKGLYDGIWFIRVDNKMGAIDKKGNWIIEPNFELVNPFSEGLSLVQLDDKWGYMDKNEEWIIMPTFEEGKQFSEELAAVQLNGKWGYIDREGKWIIKPTYDEVGSFVEGLATVKVNERWGYIDKNGELIINPVFNESSMFKNGYAKVGVYNINNDLKEGVINKKGEFIVETKYDRLFLEGLDKGGFTFNNKGLYGVISLTGDVIIEPKYTFFIQQSGNKIFMDKDTVYFLDENLNIKNEYKLGKMIPAIYDNKLIIIKTKEGLWYFDKNGELVTKMDGDFSKDFEVIDGMN